MLVAHAGDHGVLAQQHDSQRLALKTQRFWNASLRSGFGQKLVVLQIVRAEHPFERVNLIEKMAWLWKTVQVDPELAGQVQILTLLIPTSSKAIEAIEALLAENEGRPDWTLAMVKKPVLKQRLVEAGIDGQWLESPSNRILVGNPGLGHWTVLPPQPTVPMILRLLNQYNRLPRSGERSAKAR